jgi:hypothetical protein
LPLVLLRCWCCRGICDWRLAATLEMANNTAAASSLLLSLLLSSNWRMLLLLLQLLQSLHHPLQQRFGIAPRRCRLV